MANVVAYHRPASVDAALALLERPGVESRLLAGGTALIADAGPTEPIEVVDLQDTGLATIDAGPDRAIIGAAATLDDIRRADGLPGAVRDAARRELPSSLRTLATLGGTLAVGEADSEFLATLLVHDPVVAVHSSAGRRELPLAQLWAEPHVLSGAVITALSIAVDGVCAAERTARTPADRPIVAIVGRRTADGRIRLAASGVAERPVHFDDPASLHPPGDFRGATGYRRGLAVTLTRRVSEVLS